jgi:hypothetical protein
MIKQLNVFSENKPGKLENLAGILAEAKVNIKAMKISSAQEYGVLKFIVDDPKKGFESFKKAGITVSLKDVIAVEIADKPGSLWTTLRLLSPYNLNIEDAYGFTTADKKAVVILEIADPEAVEKVLERNKFNLLGSSKLYSL